MSYIKEQLIELSDQDIIDINDPSTWERRKFEEIFNDPSERLDPEQREARAKRAQEAEEKEAKRAQEKIDRHLFVRRALFHAEDIEKYDISGRRVSIVRNPEYFNEDLEKTKSKLLFVVWLHSREIIDINDKEITIRYGAEMNGKSIYVDYYVQINKTPSKEIPKTLEHICTWGAL